MKFIDRHDIERWAERYDSKGYLPNLISRLVRSTTPLGTFVEFPDGSSTFIGGWDGKVICNESTPYVPAGTSLWEFGTEVSSAGKANRDMAKRTADTLGYEPSDCTLVVVTPRFFKKKDEFRQEKIALGIWKDVLIYDSRNLEEWFEIAPVPSRWFSSYVKKYPPDGIITIEEYWKEWSTGPIGILPPKAVTAGREYESDQLLKFLQGAPAILPVQASSKDEAVAFIIATAMQFEKAHQEAFAAKALVVDTSANFRSIRINQFGLNLIAKFDHPQILYAGVADGHHVLVPLGADDTFNQDKLVLPLIDRDGLVEALKSMGISETIASSYSKESARNITVLKRLLKFPQNWLEWAEPENAKEIIPGMLIGRWNEKNKGDIELIEKLAQEDYKNFIKKISRWNEHETPPFIKIGETWRLTSPLDAWAHLAEHLSLENLNSLKECFFEGFKYGNPTLEPDSDKATFTQFLSKEKKFSSWAREGLAQSLILIGLYGKGLKILDLESPQLWVDDIINELLNDADGQLWVSLNHEMPLISEASPNSFFNAIFDSLEKSPSPLLEVFREVEGFITPTSHHTGLLWALEGLAWDPEYLNDSAIALSKLAQIDPGGTISNRPINSLVEIFKPWHYQTLASFDERMKTVRQIATITKEIGWTLLLQMLPQNHGVGHPTQKMRWRMLDHSFDKSYTYKEIWDTHSEVVDIIISVFDYSEGQLSDLLESIINLSIQDREILLSFLDSELDKIQQVEYNAWHTLRNNLSHHRSYPDTDWALSEEELKKLEVVYERLTPKDSILKYKWLFDDQWPRFPEGNELDEGQSESRHDQMQKKIDDRRVEALKIILEEYGLSKVISLSQSIKEPWFLGDTLAKVSNNDEVLTEVVELLGTSDDNVLRFAQSFIYRKSILNGEEWIIHYFEQFDKKQIKNKALAKFFIPLNQSKKLWDFINGLSEGIKNEYWLHMNPRFYRLNQDEIIYGLKELLNHSRFISAIDVASHSKEEIPSDLIVEILEKAATIESKETARLHGYEVDQLFEEIDKRSDVERGKMIHLEWLYLSILASYGNRRNPRVLHDELANNPKFFLEVLKWVYMPKDKELVEEERQGLSEEIIGNRAMQAYKLLDSWKRIPGVNELGEIDKDNLENWVKEARKLAQEADRIEVADAQIGQLLAQYPEKGSDWPPDEICQMIEMVNTDSIKRNFSSATHNKRSFSSRGPFDGGNIERGHAEYFSKLAKGHRRKHPIIARIFDGLVDGYLREAKRMDEEAERSKLDY
ncbi:hypothetical protein [Adhaeribacter radiodurans]|uniref:Uncharacterized protein n=1 Tax=Adhaeribacter radiodurans TaxID=2745197 RepID=A0A7L7L7I8_9BACT|nr:hypothetical protein [Adhaeribacter radiodurans]QMU28801.1 hypothetical protein HUW48_12475 [Adhaeribacter radiodurans]